MAFPRMTIKTSEISNEKELTAHSNTTRICPATLATRRRGDRLQLRNQATALR
jgi:hypothetical protein